MSLVRICDSIPNHWYLVSTEYKMIPPDAQRKMSKRIGAKVAEGRASHAVYVLQAHRDASFLDEAAKGTTQAAAA